MSTPKPDPQARDARDASTGSGVRGRRRGPRAVPPRRRPDPSIARVLRPFVPAITSAVVDEVQRLVSAYGPAAGNLYLANTRLTIGQAVTYFIDQVEDPDAPRTELDETLRHIGRGEAYEGRSLETFLSALHVGRDLADENVTATLVESGRPIGEVREIIGEINSFIDTMAEQAAAGYHEAQEQLSDAAHQWRRRVLELVLAGAPRAELDSYAAAGNWSVPESVVLVAIQPSASAPMPSARMLRQRALSNLHSAQPVVMLPAPVSTRMRGELAALFAEHRIAFGAPVPLRDAASSLLVASK